MTRDQVFPSQYLGWADLKGRPCVVTIESAPFEMLKSPNGEDQHKTVLHFRGTEKMLPLNGTNWDSVAEITGCPDTDDWPGYRIELYPTKTHFGGKQVDCIRVRRPANGAQQQQQPVAKFTTSTGPQANVAMGRAAMDQTDDGDEIPF